MSTTAPKVSELDETTDGTVGAEAPTRATVPVGYKIVLVLVALIAITALVFALLAYFDSDSDSSTSSTPSAGLFRDSSVPVGVPTIMSEADVRAFGAAYPPIYWAGPKDGMQYELTAQQDGNFFIRYLPAGTAAGDSTSEFLTVATYSVVDGYQLLSDQAATEGVTKVDSESGAIVITYDDDDQRAYFAFDGSDFQVEVFDPEAGVAKQLVSNGSLVLLQ